MSRFPKADLPEDRLLNRKKKLTQIHKKRLKAAKAKGQAKKQSTYVSKAERAKLEALESVNQQQTFNEEG